jgi:hypothetical protein
VTGTPTRCNLSTTMSDASGTMAPEHQRNAGSVEWLAYYTECHKFLLYSSQKFTTLMVQASVFALAVCTAVVTMAERVHVGYPQNLVVVFPALVGLVVYSTMIVVSFLQTRAAGREMARIETDEFHFSAGAGLLATIRSSSAAFFGRTWTLAVVLLYLTALIIFVFAAAFVSRA